MLRRMDGPNESNHKSNDDIVFEEKTNSHGKHSSRTSGDEDSVISDKHTELSYFYRPLPSPKLRKRKQPISMFNPQPNANEIIEVQEICIETGSQQCVKESVMVLPDITSSIDENKLQSQLHNTCSLPTTFDKQPEISDSGKEHKVIVGKDNGWISSGSKQGTPRTPMCPTTPPASPGIRRRSLGVLKTPAWGLRTYRNPDKVENNNSSPSSRRRSLVLPVRYVQGDQSPCSSRTKSLVSPDITELAGSKDFISTSRLSNSAEELGKPCNEKQLDFENTAKDESQEDTKKNATKQTANSDWQDDEVEDFRPRLRSRSLDEYRTVARENVLENLNQRKRSDQELSKPKESKRKSFDVWLTEKEQETIRKLQVLAIERQRASEDEMKRKEQRKGKSYEEWLNEKNMAVVEDESLAPKQDNTTKHERQVASKRRYDKWLMDKELRALEEEQKMVKEAKLKTIEMRKRYEERKKNKLRFLKSSLF